MTSESPSSRYGRWSIALHWLMAALLIATAAAMELRGIYPKGSDGRELLKSAHYTLGVAVFALVWLRMLARTLHATPPITPAPPGWQALLGRLVHGALYALMFGLPLLGWLALSAKGSPIALLWGLQLPAILVESRDTARSLKDLHEAGATAGYVLVALHAGAALLHHYVVRDNTLLRMLPGRR
jgi:cytochrome b561